MWQYLNNLHVLPAIPYFGQFIFKVIISLFCLFCFILLQSRLIGVDRNVSPAIFFWSVIFSQSGVPRDMKTYFRGFSK